MQVSLHFVQEVDFVFFPFKQNLQNFNAIEITFTTSIDSYTLLQPWPHEISRLTAPVRPFSDLVISSRWLILSFVQTLFFMDHYTALFPLGVDANRGFLLCRCRCTWGHHLPVRKVELRRPNWKTAEKLDLPRPLVLVARIRHHHTHHTRCLAYMHLTVLHKSLLYVM